MVMSPVCHEVVMDPDYVFSPGWTVATALNAVSHQCEWRKELKGMQVRPPVTTLGQDWPHGHTQPQRRESKKYSPI